MVIVLDPGHGGIDTGAVGNGLQEKNLTLAIAQRAAGALSAYVADIYLTRNSDRYVSLSQRATLANQKQADAFLSIHINAGGGSGFESYRYSGQGVSPETVAFQSAFHQEMATFYAQYTFPDRGMKTADFAVLRETKMKAVLSENLFIDQPTDAQFLQAHLQLIGDATARALATALHLSPVSSPPPAPTALYRVLVDGEQIGAYAQIENILRAVSEYLGSAREIRIQRIST
ncbi:MAG: N-acetylmuramoyl-L-alanine amidase [Firmicutes bacterium]|nr:N-acetylmuramoyl-L-alanine amidase [Bacillota bacterium]